MVYYQENAERVDKTTTPDRSLSNPIQVTERPKPAAFIMNPLRGFPSPIEKFSTHAFSQT